VFMTGQIGLNVTVTFIVLDKMDSAV
jgi:hypothetical protein